MYCHVRTFMPIALRVYATVIMTTALLISHDCLKLAIALIVPVVKLDPSADIREHAASSSSGHSKSKSSRRDAGLIE